MGRGFLAGIFWGGIVGIGMLLVSSQALERQSLSLPQPQATPVEVPGGTEFDQAREETDPVLPEPDEPPAAEAAELADAPTDAVDEAPSFDSAALEVPTPSVGDAGELTDAPETTTAPDAPVTADEDRPSDSTSDLVVPDAPGAAPDASDDGPGTTDAPTEEANETTAPESDTAPEDTEVAGLPDTDTDTPAVAATEVAPTVDTEVAAPATPSAPEISDAPGLPNVSGGDEEAPRLPGADAPTRPSDVAVDTGTNASPEAPALPQVVDGGGTGEDNNSSFFEKVDTLEDKAADVETDRLPRVNDGDDSDAEADVVASNDTETSSLPTIRRLGQDNSTEAEEEVADEELAEVDENAPALIRFGLPFENPEGSPLMSLVLVHESGSALSDAQLAALPQGIAIAVDASQSDAADLSSTYRGSGREVVMIPSLPEGAEPQDVEQALRVNFETIPEAVALMDISGSGFQSDREAVQQVIDVIGTSGHGLITYPRGLNTANQSAGRAGVPAGLIFRRLDGSQETAEQIRRALDRAAFRARADEAVILVGSTSPNTMAAIVEWASGNRAKSVTLAPISAALLNR